jgi:ferrochelatase
MTFENFRTLTGSTLLNTPSLSSFENIETNPKKVKRGDLFIGDNKEDINLALLNEAYGIVTSTKVEILDNEIAWFIATSLDEVLIKLLRFTLLEKNFRFIYLSSVSLELLKKIADKTELHFLTSDEKDSYKQIINADKGIFFCSNKEFLTKIYPQFETLEFVDGLFQKIKNSLFLTDFTHKEKVYKNIKISPLFLKNLEKVVYFLEENGIDYEIEKCTFNSHFHPIFVNQSLQIKPFGKSQRVVISESHESLVKDELTYLKQHALWAKSIIVVKDLEELKKVEFNFAIIVTKYEKLIQELEKNQSKEQKLLF